jgi:ADP-ribose pyrophosphatase YjhB (NUDIX family)
MWLPVENVAMSSSDISDDVSVYLDALYDRYDDFDVQQTTVCVDSEKFEAVADRSGLAEVRVRVEGTDGVLAVGGDDEWVAPGGVVESADSLSAAAVEFVSRQTGVDCRIENLDRVSLVCLQCETSDREVWQLSAVFDALAEAGTPSEGATWRQAVPEPSVAF